MLPDYNQMDNKQRWAINKLHRVAKNDATPVIYFYFADATKHEQVDINFGILPYIPDYMSDRPDTKKAEKRRLLKAMSELEELELLKKVHSHNWKTHIATIVPLNNLTAKLRGK